MLVERPAAEDVVPPEGEQVALDRVDVAGRRILERAQVGRHDPPSPGDRDRRVVERAHQRRHDVADRLDARVEHDHDRRRRPAQADVQRGRVAESLARPDDLDRQAVRRLPCLDRLEGLGLLL